jgi:hypothetical protein
MARRDIRLVAGSCPAAGLTRQRAITERPLAQPTPSGQSPVSRAYRPFMGLILNGSKGSIVLKKSLAVATRC